MSKTAHPLIIQTEIDLPGPPAELFRGQVHGRPAGLFLGGSGDPDSWVAGPLLALDSGLGFRAWDPVADGFADLAALIHARRGRGGTVETGVAVLLAYDALDADPRRLRDTDGSPSGMILTVDRSLRFLPSGRGLLTARGPLAGRAASLARPPDGPPPPPLRAGERPRTSLPRTSYLGRVLRLKEHIGRGDIYQANLSQRFEVVCRGNPAESYLELAMHAPPPHSAFVGIPGTALVSLSPETFLRARESGCIETRPIKGTRPRGASPAEDRAAASSLLHSEKDRAELLMIVDLERNDLSRVCLAGSVCVPELAELKSFATVHHLVARVQGRLKPGVGTAELIEATFPGGSISGAPKRRALQLLRQLEPVPRGFFTGCLCWFGDDGTLDSSILIRTLVCHGERVFLGAGGGIVADSDPELEWQESNHKARLLSRALGFQPEEAA